MLSFEDTILKIVWTVAKDQQSNLLFPKFYFHALCDIVDSYIRHYRLSEGKKISDPHIETHTESEKHEGKGVDILLLL